MSNHIRPLSAEQKMIQMTDEAKARYLDETVMKIQPFLTENSNIASIRNSAINAVLLAEVQRNGTPPVDQQDAVVEKCVALAERISSAQLKRKWEDFRTCLLDQRVLEVQPQFIWAAEKCGVDLSDATMKGFIRARDEAAAENDKAESVIQ